MYHITFVLRSGPINELTEWGKTPSFSTNDTRTLVASIAINWDFWTFSSLSVVWLWTISRAHSHIIYHQINDSDLTDNSTSEVCIGQWSTEFLSLGDNSGVIAWDFIHRSGFQNVAHLLSPEHSGFLSNTWGHRMFFAGDAMKVLKDKHRAGWRMGYGSLIAQNGGKNHKTCNASLHSFAMGITPIPILLAMSSLLQEASTDMWERVLTSSLALETVLL